ncbi:MAG: glycoside hydrolase family 97 C-terminal domain-containing protein [Cyclobacteriaceae bacterium]|nr:glycoside hydrolase family 97 C-terminal domain-containing protein [Cyclobacteriaceae bacterium]
MMEPDEDFLKTVPVVWDEIEFLSGYPGKFAVLARQSNGDWYVGGINGEPKDQSVKIDLTFLDEGEFDMLLIKDGETSKDLSIEKLKIQKNHSIELVMSAFGGFAIRLTNTRNNTTH